MRKPSRTASTAAVQELYFADQATDGIAIKVDEFLPLGTVFNLRGIEFIADADAEFTDGTDKYHVWTHSRCWSYTAFRTPWNVVQ